MRHKNTVGIILSKKEYPQASDEECEKMIKKWLKKNKPSVRFKDEVVHDHIEQKMNMNKKQMVDGEYYRG